MDEEDTQNRLFTSDFACRMRERHAHPRKRTVTVLAITRCFSSAAPALKLDAGPQQF
jgi:hypothetical protein